MRNVESAGAVVFALLAASCSHLHRVGVGPVVAYPGDGRASIGDELRFRAGAGTSEGDSMTVAEVQGRLRVTERTQSFGFGTGATYLDWLGDAALTLSLTPGLGIERFDDRGFLTASVDGGIGTGITLDETVRPAPPWGLWWPAPGGLMPHYLDVTRRRVVLTLELVGSLDARATREPLLSAGVLVGIAWSEERFAAERPVSPRPWL